MSQVIASHLFLCGYRGSGKSAVGHAVATLLQLPFLDTDAMIEASFGGSIADIFASEGETGFRDRETDAIESLRLLTSPHVVALGGGAILRAWNRLVLNQFGKCVWLQASADNLARRIAMDTTTQSRRPALSSLGVLNEIQKILKEREPLYAEVADLTLATDELTPDDIARQIRAWYTKPSS